TRRFGKRSSSYWTGNRFSTCGQRTLMRPQTSLLAIALLFSPMMHAASDAHGSHIPWFELIIPQIVNFTAVVVGLAIILKKPVKAYFISQYQEFENARGAAERAKSLAEVRHQEI